MFGFIGLQALPDITFDAGFHISDTKLGDFQNQIEEKIFSSNNINLSEFQSKYGVVNTKSRLGWHLGTSIKFKVNPLFYVSTGIGVTQKGFVAVQGFKVQDKNNLSQLISNFGESNKNIDFDFTYFEVPLLANIILPLPFSPSVYSGVVAGYLVDQNQNGYDLSKSEVSGRIGASIKLSILPLPFMPKYDLAFMHQFALTGVDEDSKSNMTSIQIKLNFL